ncbi:hypothetical protein ACVWZV_009267 [Bradyrhizobium sp. GM5.1]
MNLSDDELHDLRTEIYGCDGAVPLRLTAHDRFRA